MVGLLYRLRKSPHYLTFSGASVVRISVRRIVVDSQTFYWKAAWHYTDEGPLSRRINHLRVRQVRSGWTLNIWLYANGGYDYPPPASCGVLLNMDLRMVGSLKSMVAISGSVQKAGCNSSRFL